jgi:hypothetical protein
MKKLILIIFLILLINNTNAILDATFKCADKRCKEGTAIEYSVIITNNIDKILRINEISIKDVENDIYLAIYETEIGGILMAPNETKVFNFTSTVQAPPSGYTFYYVACFKTSLFNKETGRKTGGGEVCDKAVKSLTVLPLSKIECEDNSECENNEVCDTKFFKCRRIKCDRFNIASGHRCVSYLNYIVVILIAFVIVIASVFVVMKIRKH